MATIRDFKAWIDGVDLEDYNEVYCLYRAVKDLNEWGGFRCTQRETSRGNMYFVKCDYTDDILMLASDKARDYFLDDLEKTHAGELDMEHWYGYKYSLEKED